MNRWYVYRFLDYKGETIYVGRTIDLYQRIKNHKKDDRIKKINKVQYIEFDNEEDQYRAELLYINKFNPRFNRYSKKKTLIHSMNLEGQRWIEPKKEDFEELRTLSKERIEENRIKNGNNEETITVTITLPKSLAKLVDKKAKKELRSRSGQIASIISEHFKKEVRK